MRRFTPRPPDELLRAAIAAGRSRRRARRRIRGAVIGSAIAGCVAAATVLVAAPGVRDGSPVALSAGQRAQVVASSARRSLGVVVPATLLSAAVTVGSPVPPAISAALEDTFGQWQPLLVEGLEAAEQYGELAAPSVVIDLSRARHQQLAIGRSSVGVDSLQGEVGDASHQVWSASLLLFASGGGDLVLVGPCGRGVGAPGSGGQVQQTCPGIEVDFPSVIRSGSGTVGTFVSHRTVAWIGFGSTGS
jgi:hypothetical protein